MRPMPRCERGKLSRPRLAGYFREAFRPREEWLVGMEVEAMGVDAASGRPLPYEGPKASVLSALEAYRDIRGGAWVQEGDRPIGIDGPWGTISLEPGGQFEWSARPARDLDGLSASFDGHRTARDDAGARIGARWLDVAVQPEAPLSEMPWMPKARYGIMREVFGRKGRLAHRMMTPGTHRSGRRSGGRPIPIGAISRRSSSILASGSTRGSNGCATFRRSS
jgi:glutamate--cysteine ligase